jgi:hypothetical protein
MDAVVAEPLAARSAPTRRLDTGVVGIWMLVGALVLYLALDGGGYGIVAHSQVAIVVWWIVLVAAAFGLLPVARLSRAAVAGLSLFGGFVAWTALATTWSLSSERSLADLSLVAGYLGVLVLGVSIHRDRDRALRHTIGALATAIAIVGALALASRLDPGLISAAEQTGSFLPGTARRLSWPLNYWNALAALMAFGLPLLLTAAVSARRLLAQALAAAGIPLVVLCAYLTFSRGGAAAGAVALAAFVAFAPERFPKLATILVAGAGGAALIASASTRAALEKGLVDTAARHQGETLVPAILLVCAGVALAQVGLGLAARHGTPPRFLVVSPRRARALLGAAVAAAVVVALIMGAPTKLSHAWRDFKQPTAAGLHHASLTRFGTISGNGRYQLWKVAVDAASDHVLRGSGPGTYQLLFLPRAPASVGYVQNAHSLYFETLAETGVVGLVLLVGFLLTVVAVGVGLVIRSRYEHRIRAAGALAALIAFMVSAAFDWIWQVPVLPVAFMLLTAALIASPRDRGHGRLRLYARYGFRVGLVVAALACLAAIAVPLATATAIQRSQAAAASGDTALALRDAQAAVGVEPGAASAQVQLALVEELRGELRPALVAARRAVRDEPVNWAPWLVLSRLEAETGNAAASVADFRRARLLNPNSPLFAYDRRS